MSAIPMDYVTIAQAAEQLRATGKPIYAKCLETMVRAGDLLNFTPIITCNQGTIHKVQRRTTLGTGGVFRAINQGVPTDNPETEVDFEVAGNLEDRCDIDEDLLRINGNSPAFIQNQNEGIMLGMRNKLNDTILYGNRAAPGQSAGFTGFATRYNAFGKWINPNTGYDHVQDFSNGTAAAGNNYTSIYLIAPGPRSIYLIRQDNGMPAGLSIRTFGPNEGVFLNDRNGNPFLGHRTWYKWPIGLAIENPHALIRLANIPVADIAKLIQQGVTTPADSSLCRKMIEMKNMVSEDVDKSQLKYLVSRDVFTEMDILMFEKTNAYWTPETMRTNWPARTVGMFSGIPVFMSDSIINTESPVLPTTPPTP